MIRDIWNSFLALPTWVKIWAFLILMPMNMATLLFIGQPGGILVAALANIAMMMNMPVMFHDRGFSRLMGVPHLVPWTILVIYLAFFPPPAEGLYATFLTALMVVNTISLVFDYPDSIRWLRGDRAPAGRDA